MGKKGRILVAAGCWLAAASALSHAEPSPSTSIRDPQVSDIFVPADRGYVTDTAPAANPDAPLLVHIQEAHTNYEGQKNLAAILEKLIEKHGLKLILVEGGTGDASLSYLRGYGSLQNRKEVAEKYLRLGILSGEEYLDMTSDEPLILWGVEKRDLYQQNVQAFMEVEPLQATARPLLDSLRETVEALKPAVADPALVELETKRRAFDQDTVGLADYAGFLYGAAQRRGVAVAEYRELGRFVEVHGIEQELQREAVQKEQQALLEQLSEKMSEDQVQRLIARAREMQAGTLKADVFYTALAKMAAAAQIDLSATHPQLARYIRYVTESARIAPDDLAEEMDRLAVRLREALTTTEDGRRLAAIDEQVDLVRKLVDLELSPEEHARFLALPAEGLCAGWDRELNGLLAGHGLPRRSFHGLSDLQAMLPAIQKFYDAANNRDQALVDNALAKVRESGERLAVLITGGFHAPRITALLKEKGAGVVVVAPKIEHPTDEALYHAVLKYKSGRGSFKDVQSAAAQRPSPVASN
jgi:hypothetical protein